MASRIVEKIIDTDSKSFLQQEGMMYSFLNPVSYLDALRNKELYCKMDGLFADGSLLVAAIKLCYGKKVERCSFDMTSLAPKLFEYAQKNKKTVYIVASKQKQVEKAVEFFRDRYQGIMIGFRNGYFADEKEQDEEAMRIVEKNPDFLIVGMGAIKQEEFLLRTKEVGYKGIGFTCGGFISQTAMMSKEMNYYPAWIDKYNLRFLYRMCKEPHTRKRYMKAGFVFPVKFLWERFKG